MATLLCQFTELEIKNHAYNTYRIRPLLCNVLHFLEELFCRLIYSDFGRGVVCSLMVTVRLGAVSGV